MTNLEKSSRKSCSFSSDIHVYTHVNTLSKFMLENSKENCLTKAAHPTIQYIDTLFMLSRHVIVVASSPP